jgi:dihydroorotate dehydrogenase
MTDILFKLGKPFLHALDAETAHTLTIHGLKTGLYPACAPKTDPRLAQNIWGKTFSNPVGLAAGFDKNADVIAPMLKMGFGFVEVGTVTPKPQGGNPRPRVFRDKANKAVINRMGFPNAGLNAFKRNVEVFRSRKSGMIGLNIGMNKEQTEPAKDYTLLIRELGALADYLTVNISSPNTPGLRNLQEPEFLEPLLSELIAARNDLANKPPLLVKLAPDLTEQQQHDIAAVLLDVGIDGVILGNTTLDRPDYLSANFREQKGGLSGAPLTQKSTTLIRHFYKLTNGKLPIIGVGGISSAQDAYDKIRAGASLVQLYSALVYHGPALINEINKGLVTLMQKDGLDNLSDAIGADA